MSGAYKPQDSMYLWWLADSLQPQLIGRLDLVENGRKVAFSYADAWLMDTSAFALSDDLPLHKGMFIPAERDCAAGAVEDARPDQWGERVIRLIERPPRLSLLEYLYFAGDERFGALGVSLNADSWAPVQNNPIPSFEGLPQIGDAVRRVLAGETVPEAQRRLLRPGASFGGARPKSLLQMDGHQWVVKFSDGGELDDPLLEHTTMELARSCGIHAAETKALRLSHKHAVAIKRFDRRAGRRLHVMSAYVALRAAHEEYGYPELSQLFRRMCRPEEIRYQQAQLFRRMIFNILMDNTDDHEKNHALVREHDGYWRLSEAFDILPIAQGLGYQQMRVGSSGSESTLDNALSQVSDFGLRKDEAVQICREVCKGVDGWKAHFQANEVPDADIERVAFFVDRPYLLDQRRDFLN